MHKLDEQPNYLPIELKLELSNRGEYNSTNCYKSIKEKDNEALIKGIYIERRPIFGKMPSYIDIKLMYCDKWEINVKAVENLYSEKYFKHNTNIYILNDKYLFMFGLFSTPSTTRKKNINHHVSYKSTEIKFRKTINNIIFHRKHLPVQPPHKMSFEIKWEYAELQKQIADSMQTMDMLFEVGEVEKLLRVYE